MTEVKCGKLTIINAVIKRYILDTSSGAQYTLAGNDEKLSLYDDDGEVGQIFMDRDSLSGSIKMEKKGATDELDGLIGEYQKIDGKYRILSYENGAAKDSWLEDLHPLDYLIQNIVEAEKK